MIRHQHLLTVVTHVPEFWPRQVKKNRILSFKHTRICIYVCQNSNIIIVGEICAFLSNDYKNATHQSGLQMQTRIINPEECSDWRAMLEWDWRSEFRLNFRETESSAERLKYTENKVKSKIIWYIIEVGLQSFEHSEKFEVYFTKFNVFQSHKKLKC